MEEPTIISINEFRKLTGFASATLSDSQVVELIRRLDTMAQIYIRHTAEKSGKDSDDDPTAAVPNSTIGS